MILLPCPGCERMLQVDDSRSGMLGKCKRCGATFRVPGEKQSLPGPAAVPPSPIRDRQLSTEKAAPAPSPPQPVPQPSRAAKPPLKPFSAVELIKAKLTPAPAPALAPVPLPPPAVDLELVEDETPAPSRPVAKPEPPARDPAASSSESVMLEDGDRRPLPATHGLPRQAITSSPAPFRSPRPAAQEEVQDAEPVEFEDEDDDWSEARRPVRNDRAKHATAPTASPGGGWYVGIAAAVLLWVVMTPCAFLYRPAAYATLFVGIGIGYVGRRWLYRIAKQESSTAWLMMMLVPFYRFFFFFTHVSQTLVPFLLWLCGTLFVISGGFTLVFHTFLEKNGKQLATNPFDFEPPQAEMSTPEAIDAEAARLLLGNKKEARVWLKEPENRHDRQARRLIEGAYANGAKDVYAVGFDDDETQFVVVLPVDAAKRKKLFDWHREADPTVQDVGQKYLLLSPD